MSPGAVDTTVPAVTSPATAAPGGTAPATPATTVPGGVAQPVVVGAPATTAVADPGLGASLPTTGGGDFGRTLLIALLTVVLGVGALVAVRRRHHHA